MAATRGQQIQDRCRPDATRHHSLCRPDREAGVKVRGSTAELATREPID
jgi:hypothetical protein